MDETFVTNTALCSLIHSSECMVNVVSQVKQGGRKIQPSLLKNMVIVINEIVILCVYILRVIPSLMLS